MKDNEVNFYFFRHGQTSWNRERRCQGHSDIPLCEDGKSEAHLLAKNISAGLKLECLFSSDLLRASETAEIVNKRLNLPLIYTPQLREVFYGPAEGLLFEEAILLYGKDLWDKLQNFKKENDEISFPGAETRKQSKERVLNLLYEIIKTKPYKNIGISTHGGIIRNIIHHFLPEENATLLIPNCVTYLLTFDSLKSEFKCSGKPLEFSQ